MNIVQIRKCDIANGPGVRVSLFLAGCHKSCKNCFNTCAKSFSAGKPFSKEMEKQIFAAIDRPHITGLSLLGGDPVAPENQRDLIPFLHRFRNKFGDTKSIWCWTGYIYETELLSEEGAAHCDATNDFLSLIDVLVDGPYVDELRNLTLKFRGSSNQRILKLHPIVEDITNVEKI